MPDAAAAGRAVSLLTQANINTQLRAAGLPDATVTSSAVAGSMTSAGSGGAAAPVVVLMAGTYGSDNCNLTLTGALSIATLHSCCTRRATARTLLCCPQAVPRPAANALPPRAER